jgi:LEA14-like dessication related protein
MFYFRKKGLEKFRKTIDLFDKKSNEVVRKIHFKNPNDFNQFLRGLQVDEISWLWIEVF